MVFSGNNQQSSVKWYKEARNAFLANKSKNNLYKFTPSKNRTFDYWYAYFADQTQWSNDFKFNSSKLDKLLTAIYGSPGNTSKQKQIELVSGFPEWPKTSKQAFQILSILLESGFIPYPVDNVQKLSTKSQTKDKDWNLITNAFPIYFTRGDSTSKNYQQLGVAFRGDARPFDLVKTSKLIAIILD